MIPKYKIVNEGANTTGYTIETDRVDNRPWGEVDKRAMRDKLARDKANNVPGVNKAIKEVYAIVGSVNDKMSWKYPHHVLIGRKVVLNRKGLGSATSFLARDNSNSADDIAKAKRHLARHYRQIGEEAPVAVTESGGRLFDALPSDESQNRVEQLLERFDAIGDGMSKETATESLSAAMKANLV